MDRFLRHGARDSAPQPVESAPAAASQRGKKSAAVVNAAAAWGQSAGRGIVHRFSDLNLVSFVYCLARHSL